ncbi:MAG: hypothetical protein HUU03_04610 [Planctomycetaceae bacterium]|nr:hypothetical protein [Planctomycetota bacterium]NUO15706.1 hypothetical protein [Planctomycetaceae bacterium]
MTARALTVDEAASLARELVREAAYPCKVLSGRTEIGVISLAGAVGRKVGHHNNAHQVAEILIGANLVVWELFRCGLLNPLDVDLGTIAQVNPRFYFTDAGETWMHGKLVGNPLAAGYIESLLAEASIFKGEPALVYAEALKAKSEGLLRASMILLGLSAENMVGKVFDDGVKTGKVIDDQARSRRYAAFAVQADVATAIQRLEDAKAIEKGDTTKWILAANTYRDMRNDCAHDAKYQPDPFEVETGFFAWTHFVSVTNKAWVLFTK